MTLIFHMARKAEWDAAQAAGFYQGAAEDRVDGFIHFSTAVQVKESAAKQKGGHLSKGHLLAKKSAAKN